MNATDIPEPGEVYFIPHQAVIRKHAASTRLRIVFDASSKALSDLASLNVTGPSLTPEIMNVLIHFRAWKFDLVADVRKAFHQIQIDEKHRNFLRFIWLGDVLSDNPKLLILRFQRVIFGVNSSPFLLNGTLYYHISKYFEADPEFAEKLLEALYIDDLSSGDKTVNGCFELYKKTVNCFHSGGFQLHNWASNSQHLMKLIESDKNSERPDESQPKTMKFGSLEDEQSFAKLSIKGADKLDLDNDGGKPTNV